ncbi:MAG: threonine/serine exporter family protein [Oscillospiraceae bacterium]|nr:threonine/serine exporter family protein [Oscillospiraceae bacterium]
MPKKETIEHRRQSHLEEVLDFCAALGRSMILSGANTERVSLAVEHICHVYELHDVSVYLLSTYISVAGRDGEGRYAARQFSIPAAGIHLERLKRLNRLSYTVASTRPAPERLGKMLQEAENARDYADWAVLLGQVSAMMCLAIIFGGTWREVLAVAVVTVILHYVAFLMAKPGLDRIVVNAVTMFIASVSALALTFFHLSDNGPVILITVSMLLIPGIPLVNAVRNLLCGHEMNGILQLAKVIVETLALAMGIFVALSLFIRSADSMSTTAVPLTNPWILIPVSALASVAFGVVFRIPPHDLVWAGLGGALTRVVLILSSAVIPIRLMYVTLAAFVASLYAELMATARKDPATYFLYPSIVPLIPGDLFFYSLIGVYVQNRQMFETNGSSCLLTLLGMSIGFVLSSTVAHYIRKARRVKLWKLPLLRK